MNVNEITETTIGAAIEVHRALGPGLLESAYLQRLCHELHLRGLTFVTERSLPVIYKGLRLDCGFRVDPIAAEAVVVEIKAVRTFGAGTRCAASHVFAPGRLEGRSLDQFQRSSAA